MSKSPRDATLQTLQRVRADVVVDAETAWRGAGAALQVAEAALAQARERLARLTSSSARDEVQVTAGALQRRQACSVALERARTKEAARVKQALVVMSEARAALQRAEADLNAARVDVRVVERQRERHQMNTQQARARAEDDDNDELAQRRG